MCKTSSDLFFLYTLNKFFDKIKPVMIKGEISWWHVLILTILISIISGEFLVLHPGLLSKNSAALEQSVVDESIPEPTGINPNFINQVNECFIPVASVYGYSLRINSGFRSISYQEQIFNQGRTENGHIVTWSEPGRSLHNYGYAVDVVDKWRGYNIDWKELKKIGAYCGLEQVDDPHFEYRDGLSTEDFAIGKRPPLLTLPCEIMDERAKTNKPLTLDDLKSCNAPKF